MADSVRHPARVVVRPVPGQRHDAARRAQFRRRRLGALAAASVVVFGAVASVRWLAGSPTVDRPSATATSPGATSLAPKASTGPSAAISNLRPVATVPPTTLDPGTLPQTVAFPTTTSAVFAANMASLWSGIAANNLVTAQRGFFPESAYLRLKKVADPRADFSNRLLNEYRLDISAAHALLGANAATAQFVGVDADASFGHWVPPGACFNDIGYFELPNSRLIYRVAGQIDSVGIASMISWRGEWYVVHLGAVNRSGNGGQVDDPEIGRGVSVNSATC